LFKGKNIAMKKFATLILLLLGWISPYFAQKNDSSVSGILKDSTGAIIPFATVYLEKTAYSTTTSEKGRFILNNVPPGDYTIIFSAVGYTQKKRNIHTPLNKELITTLSQNVITTGEVVVTGKSEAQNLREISYAVNVIDVKKYSNSTADLNQLLNKSTGVHVREEGGLGSNFNFSLNGFSGNQVRFFLDGIPMSNFGASLGLNNIPINMAERIEVYKGVVPIWLGADALGGAVNIVTNQKIRNFVDASYSYGSLNTHRASVNASLTEKSGFTVRTNIFSNYSDNNFLITTKEPDPFSGTFGEPKAYRHFHDRYRSGAAILETGFLEKKWADKLLIGVIISGNDKQIQQGATMQKVIGEAYTTNRSVIPTFKYQKKNFLIKKLDFNIYSSYNISKDESVDTSAKKFRWNGEYSYSIYGDKSKQGEFGDKSYYIYKGRNFLNTANLSYDIDTNHSVGFNYTGNMYERHEKDLVRPSRPGLIAPKISTHIVGFGYKLIAFKKKFSATVFGKYFIRETQLNTVKNTENGQKDSLLRSGFQQPGYGIAASYFIIPQLQFKTSFENTYRLPESEEMLGNGLNILSNPLLRPEHSNNFNAELQSRFVFFRRHELRLEVGYIYRSAADFIRGTANGPKMTYENVNSVEVNGIEGGIKYVFKELLFIEANATYQNIINTDKYDPPKSNIKNYLYGLRLPNVPYLFGNASTSLNFKHLFLQEDNVSVGYSCNYVEGFYLFWPSLGNPEYKREIPTQFIQNTSLSYSMKDSRYNISLECQNLFNVKAYDYFYVQKPGRMFFIKLRYFFKK
jgi:outer membrane cobalamin receptor